MTRTEAMVIVEKIFANNKGEQILAWLLAQAIIDACEEGRQLEREAQAIRQHEGRMAGRGL